MGEIALMVREEIIDDSSDEDNVEYWKAKAGEMLQRVGETKIVKMERIRS